MATTQSHRQAIVTRFLPPTDNLDARVACRSDAGRTVYYWNDALDQHENHAAAVQAHAESFGWDVYNDFVGGSLYSAHADAYCFVAVPKAVQP